MLKRILAAFFAAALVLGLVSCNREKEDNDDETSGEAQSYTAQDIVMESENFQFNRAEFSYQFYRNYNDFIILNEDYMSYFGFDTTVSLKEQAYSEEMTWFDYFAEPSLEYLRQMLLLCEGARAAEIELDEEDFSQIDSEIESIETYVQDYEYDLEDFITTLFGTDVTLETMRSYLEKDRLAYKYRDVIVGEYDFSEEDLTAYLDEHTDDFYFIDYLSYTFDEDTDADAVESAEGLAAVTDAASFEAFVRTYETTTLEKAEDEVDLSALSSEYMRRDEDSAFSEWAFGGAQAGTTYVDRNEVDGIYTVYLLTRAPYLQDYVTKNFRYVYMTLSTYGTYDQVLERANELVDTWRAGDADAHSFGELAYNYSEDASTAQLGGLQEDLGMAPSKFPDSVVDWLYDSARQVGDVDVIRGENAYFIVYFEGDGQIEWESEARAALTEEAFIADLEALGEIYETTVYEEVANSLSA